MNNAEPVEDTSDYHVTTSQHARQLKTRTIVKLKAVVVVLAALKLRVRRRKVTNTLNLKLTVKKHAAVRGGKGGKQRKGSALQQGFQKPAQAVNRDVVIGETITVGDLANKMAVKGSQVIKAMMKLGAMATINRVIDRETAQLVAEEMGHKVILRRENELEEAVMSDRDTGAAAEPRTGSDHHGSR